MIGIIDNFSVLACKMAMICLCPTIKEQLYEFLSLCLVRWIVIDFNIVILDIFRPLELSV